MNINLLSFSNNKKASHICVKYGSEDVYTAGKSANCDLTPNWAQFISVAGQRLYTIQRRGPISAMCYRRYIPDLCFPFKCVHDEIDINIKYTSTICKVRYQQIYQQMNTILFNPLTSWPGCMPGSRYTGVRVLFFVIWSWNCWRNFQLQMTKNT